MGLGFESQPNHDQSKSAQRKLSAFFLCAADRRKLAFVSDGCVQKGVSAQQDADFVRSLAEANSCLYEHGEIKKNIRPGGFILGDEGGGAVLGRMFLSDYIKGLVPEGLAALFDSEFGLDYPDIVKGVYKAEAPSRFVASFARFVCDNRNDGYAAGLIERNIRVFIERSLSRYGNPEVGIVGSFGCACCDELETIGKEYGLAFVKFVKSPIDALVAYHLSK